MSTATSNSPFLEVKIPHPKQCLAKATPFGFYFFIFLSDQAEHRPVVQKVELLLAFWRICQPPDSFKGV